MTPKEWHRRYVQRLVTKGQFTCREAEDILQDWREAQHSYDDDPESAADEELSYWEEL